MLFAASAALAGCSSEPQAQAPGAGRTQDGTPRIANNSIDAIAALPEFARLRAMLRMSGLEQPWRAMPAATLLAPRDTAFARLTPPQRAALADPANADAVRAALRGMMLPRLLRAAELRQMIDDAGGTLPLNAVDGSTLTFTRAGDRLIVTNAAGASASMASADIEARRGAVYVLDGWIGPIPPPRTAPLPPPALTP